VGRERKEEKKNSSNKLKMKKTLSLLIRVVTYKLIEIEANRSTK